MSDFLYPIKIDFVEWASQIRILAPNYSFPNPEKEEDWRDWAAQVINSNSLSQIPIPTKQIYPKTEDWRKWAAFLLGTITNSS